MNKSAPVLCPVYLNKSSGDLPGEYWKDVPGFEGYYQASSLGRVKSLDRIITHPSLEKMSLKGKILSQTVHKNKNMLGEEDMVDLGITLTMGGRVYFFIIRRLIYMTFLNPDLDYRKNRLCVINMDYDGYNNSIDNLKLITNSERQKRSVSRNRVIPYLQIADRTNWKKGWNVRAVAQYDLDGKLLAEFPSIRAAGRQLNIDGRGIGYVASGKFKQWKGSVWKYIEKQHTPK